MLELRRALSYALAPVKQNRLKHQAKVRFLPVVFERSSSSKKMGRKAPYRVEDSLYPTFNSDLRVQTLIASKSLLNLDENAVRLDCAESISV